MLNTTLISNVLPTPLLEPFVQTETTFHSPRACAGLGVRFLTFSRPRKIFNFEYIIGGNESLPWRKGLPWSVPAHEVSGNFPRG